LDAAVVALIFFARFISSRKHFIIRDLTAPNVDHVRTALAIRNVKHEVGVPLE
jgi:hypothetical protein